MISYEDALERVRQHLAGKSGAVKLEPVVNETITIERPFGWVFFYDSKLFLDTGDDDYALIGNSPIIVDRSDGSLHTTGSGQPIQSYIEEYEREHAQSGPGAVRNEAPGQAAAPGTSNNS